MQAVSDVHDFDLHSQSLTDDSTFDPKKLSAYPPVLDSQFEVISDDELKFCIHRQYLTGSNTFSSPLHLSSQPDLEFASIVYDYEFSRYAKEMNHAAKWPASSIVTYYFLFFLCYPLSLVYLNHQRKKRITSMKDIHFKYDFSLFRNYDAKALGDSLKFGYSSCFTLAWIDVLSPASHATKELQVGKPSIPMVLVCAGDGSFANPFSLDFVDPFVKACSQYFGPQWFLFLIHLNSHLRVIRPSSPSSMKSCLVYLETVNRLGVGIGWNMPVCGLQVRLGLIPSRSSSPSTFSTFEPPQQSNCCGGEPSFTPAVILDFKPEIDYHSDASVSPNAVKLQRRDNVGTQDMHEPFLANDLVDAQFGSSSYPYGTIPIDDVNDAALNSLNTSSFFYNRSVLRYNVLPSSFSLLSLGLMMGFLVILHLLATLLLATVYWQFINTTYLFVLLIYPFGDLWSSLFGIAAVLSVSPTITRLFSYFHMLSFVNGFVALVVGLRRFHSLGLYSIVLPSLLIAVKIMVAFVTNIFLAHTRFSDEFVLSRHEFLLNKMDTSTPKLHLKNAPSFPQLNTVESEQKTIVVQSVPKSSSPEPDRAVLSNQVMGAQILNPVDVDVDDESDEDEDHSNHMYNDYY